MCLVKLQKVSILWNLSHQIPCFFTSIQLASDSSIPIQVAERRRSIILAIVAKTPSSNMALRKILENGFLINVRIWLSEALAGSIGGIDFLLHLVSSVTFLPVTKDMVASSKMGKTVVQAEKSKRFADSPNLEILKQRVERLKDEWTKSVKFNKSLPVGSPTNKRKVSRDGMTSPSISSVAKKAKTIEKKGLSTSDLLRKTLATPNNTGSSSPDNGSGMSAADKARMRAKERLEKEKARLAGNPGPDGETSILIGNINGAEAKSKKKVTFAEEPIILNASEDGVR